MGVLNNVEWKKLAQELGLEGEVASIQGACQNHPDPVPCLSGEVLWRFNNRQGIETCCATVTKIARALKLLNHELAAEELIKEICTPKGKFTLCHYFVTCSHCSFLVTIFINPKMNDV